MSSVSRPPEPWLVAIILIVRSRAGPRYVFHAPADPDIEKLFGPNNRHGRGANDSDSDEGSESSSDEDDEPSSLGTAAPGSRQNNSNVEDNVSTTTSSAVGDTQRPPSLNSGRTKKRTANSDAEESPGLTATGRGRDGSLTTSRAPWDSIFGLPTDVWEKLLSPTRTWHKRRFEVGINDLTFIGWPVFVRDDGAWRKRRRRKKRRRPESERGQRGHQGQTGNTEDDDAEDNQENEEDDGDRADDSSATVVDDRANGDQGQAADGRAQNGSPDADKDSMKMFNVVFVMAPPILEYPIHVREMYENVIKKFSKALKHEQARCDYVWKETQRILQIKEKAREREASASSLYNELVSQSPLARAIGAVFDSISESKIASVSLNSHASTSLQITPLASISSLPSATDMQFPGLWLTTANSLIAGDHAAPTGLEAPNQILARHFALLLLESESKILEDVKGTDLGPALAHYLRYYKPNKSLAQVAAKSGIPLAHIKDLTDHLVYWRRARMIPPLHQRDTYIVSPNCDLSKLSLATKAYSLAFPSSPSLPKMLSVLSGTPRPYASFIPSKEHKESYFAILAWLLRGGWVTQLRSFGRVKATPEIKIAVEQALRKEQVEKYVASGRPATPSSEAELDDYDGDGEGSSSSSSLASQESDQDSPISERRDSDDQYGLSDSFMDRNSHLNTSSLILFPHRASPLESRWLDEIMYRFPERSLSSETSKSSKVANGHDVDDPAIYDSLKRQWPQFVKYFNGHDALEKIAIREGMSRKGVWQFLMRLGLGQPVGLDLDPREQVLVIVRHW